MKYFLQASFILLLCFSLIPIESSCKKQEVPILTTCEVTNIRASTATCGGTITSEGSGTVIERGICWSKEIDPHIADTRTINGAGAGSYISNLTDLEPITTYYVRAYATNSGGTGYGMAMSFTTLGQNIGTWQFTEKITSDGIIYNTIRTFKMTKNTFEEIYVVQHENSSTISAIIGTRGSLEMTSKSLIFALREIGTCVLDQSQTCTGEVQWYGEGTQYWIDNINYFEKKVIGEYEVNGTNMRLKRDLNDDGDHNDSGEDITFKLI